MGQATVDLPDPLENAPAPLTNADDLLAQLAGQEIDRMLADSDVEAEHAGDGTAGHTAPGGAEITSDPAYQKELDDLFNQLQAAPIEDMTVQGAPPVEPAPAPAELAAAIAPPPASAEAPAAVPQPLPAAPPAPAEQPTTAAEREALNAPPDLATTIEQAVVEVHRQRTGPLVRALELINFPFSACPDAVRDLLGQFAILTFMNAIAVLLYLLIFRA